MQVLAQITAALVVVAMMGCGGRVALIGVERFMDGTHPPRATKLEILQSIGIMAVLQGLVFNANLTLVGLLVFALGILLQGDESRPRQPLEVPLLVLSLVCVFGIGICKALRYYMG